MSKMSVQIFLAIDKDADFIYSFEVAGHLLTDLIHVDHPI